MAQLTHAGVFPILTKHRAPRSSKVGVRSGFELPTNLVAAKEKDKFPTSMQVDVLPLDVAGVRIR